MYERKCVEDSNEHALLGGSIGYVYVVGRDQSRGGRLSWD
jgi:hypothetical protein